MLKFPLGLAAVAALALAAGPAEAGRGHGSSHESSSGHERPATDEIVVDNPRSGHVQVIIDGRFRGLVEARDAERFRVGYGRHQVLLRDPEGDVIIVSDVSVSGERGVRMVAPLSLGTLQLENRSGTTLSMEVDGQVVASLYSGQRSSLELEEGRHKVRALYPQLGSDRVLQSSRLNIEEHRSSRMVLEPATVTLARVQHSAPMALELVINGVSQGLLLPGEDIRAELPVGPGRVELRHEGRVVASESPFFSAYADNFLRLDPVLFGSVSVSNPLPIPVELIGPKGEHVRVAAYGSARFSEVEAGRITVRVERLTGETIGRLSARVEPGERESLRVAVPTEGIVVLRSASPELLTAFANGAFVASVSPGSELRLSLPTGSQVLEVRDSRGREVLESRLWLDPYQEARLTVDTPARRPDRGYSSSEHGHQEHESVADRGHHDEGDDCDHHDGRDHRDDGDHGSQSLASTSSSRR